MEIAKLVLDYLNVLLSPQMVAGIVILVFLNLFGEDIKALILRVAKLRFPGGTEILTPQSERPIDETEINKPLPKPDVNYSNLPSGLSDELKEQVEAVLNAERATSYLWEYRYLNHFLVHTTQRVLDWFIGLPQPTTYRHYDSTWLPLIPSASERVAIVEALKTHHLIIQTNNEMIEATPKGREYQLWRGELPRLPTA